MKPLYDSRPRIPAVTPKSDAVRDWRFERVFVLWTIDSGTKGDIWSSLSDGILSRAASLLRLVDLGRGAMAVLAQYRGQCNM